MVHKYTSYDSFKKENGDIDWGAYYKAQKNNGETCYKCGQSITWPKGYQTLCYQCANEKRDQEFSHDMYVRCPKCGEKWDPYQVARDGGGSDVMYDGQHEVYCQGDGCDATFEVSTRVEYHFTSPPMLPEEKHAEEE